LAKPEYAHLITSTWALIGHESISTEKGTDYGMFGKVANEKYPDMANRIKKYSEIGRKTIN
jgi:hypothetical protein